MLSHHPLNPVCGPRVPKSRRLDFSLLMELEASLQSSQRALLAGDGALLEQTSGEQLRLLRALSLFWPPDPAPADPALRAELQAARIRVLHLGRVQAALLARAQRWQRTIENLLAGTARNYAPSGDARVPRMATPAGTANPPTLSQAEEHA